MRDIILRGQRKVDEVRKTAPPLFIERDILSLIASNYRYEDRLLNDVDDRIHYNDTKILFNHSPEGIFRNLPEKNYMKSINALNAARQHLVCENSEKHDEAIKKLEEVGERLRTLERIFDNNLCYALR